MESLKNKLYIDKFNLDRELLEIASLIQEYSELNVEAVKYRDKQKLKLEVLEASIATELRKNWDNLGYDKAPTGPQTDAHIKLDEKYQQEAEKLIDLAGEVSYYSATVNSFEAKRRALANLVSLAQMNYWVPGTSFNQDNLNDTMNRRGK